MTRSLTILLFSALSGRGAGRQSYVPHRVFDTARGTFSDFEAMAADAAASDLVFLGEQHDDPNTHRLELAVLEALSRRKAAVVLSLEMFERDVQDPLEHFAMGHMEEAEFLKATRPWPAYRTDYKPLVDLAIKNGWPVVAANVPRPIAAEVAKSGPDVLQSKSEADRKLFAAELKCPTNDEYFDRFTRAMGGGHTAEGAAASDAAKNARALLLLAVSQGRNDGRVDRGVLHGRQTRVAAPGGRARQRRIPQRLQPGHRRPRPAGLPASDPSLSRCGRSKISMRSRPTATSADWDNTCFIRSGNNNKNQP
jgi:hypothetical protein